MSVVWIVVIAVAMAAFGYLAGLLSGSLNRNKLSSRLAFTEAQLQSALDKVEEISRVDAGLLAQAKEEAAKQVAGVKEEAEVDTRPAESVHFADEQFGNEMVVWYRVALHKGIIYSFCCKRYSERYRYRKSIGNICSSKKEPFAGRYYGKSRL